MNFSLKSFYTSLAYIVRHLPRRERIILASALIVLLITGSALIMRASYLNTTLIPTRGGTLTEGMLTSPRFINPLLAESPSELDLTHLVYSGLVRKIDAGTYIPDLAEQYTISPDGKTYTFVLRDNAVFHDGIPVSASDVVFTVNKALDPDIKSPRAINWQGVVVSAPDEKTVVFKLQQPFSGFIDTTTLGILPEHLWSQFDDSQFLFTENNITAIGSGPYMINRVRQHKEGAPSEYQLKAFKKFVLGEPFITHLTIVLFNTEAQLGEAIASGRIDSALFAGTSPEVATLRKHSTDIPLARNFGLFFNSAKNKNPLLTKAGMEFINQALDRDKLVATVTRGHGIAHTSPLPPYPAFLDNLEEKSSVRPFSPEELESFTQKQGWTYDRENNTLYASSKENGKQPLTLTLSTGNAEHLISTAEYIRSVLEPRGIRVTVVPYDSATLADTILAKKDFEVLVFGHSFQHDTALYAFWHSSQRTYPGLNITQYARTEVDELLEKARITTHTEDRYALYRQVAHFLTQDSGALFLYSPTAVYYHPYRLIQPMSQIIDEPYDRLARIYEWSLRGNRVWNIFVHTENS